MFDEWPVLMVSMDFNYLFSACSESWRKIKVDTNRVPCLPAACQAASALANITIVSVPNIALDYLCLSLVQRLENPTKLFNMDTSKL